jgi:hypothetical protein
MKQKILKLSNIKAKQMWVMMFNATFNNTNDVGIFEDGVSDG